MEPSKAVLLGNPGNAERLARKSGTKDVVRRDVRYFDFIDVAMGKLAEVCLVSLLAELGGNFSFR
jgi:hypothetical protein